MFLVSISFSPPHKDESFEARNEHAYNLKQNSQFSWPFVKSVYHGTNAFPI